MDVVIMDAKENSDADAEENIHTQRICASTQSGGGTMQRKYGSSRGSKPEGSKGLGLQHRTMDRLELFLAHVNCSKQ